MFFALKMQDVFIEDLLFLSTKMKQALKKAGSGKSVSKDFLLPDSRLTYVTRGKETQSRKCTIVGIDELDFLIVL